MAIAVILTVLNEAQALPRLLDSLAAQARLPDEIVVAEGGSRDATPAILATYAEQFAARGLLLRVVAAPGANIAQGRNAAIAAATSDVIAATDAGVRLPPEWLERLTAPFADPAVNVVAGFFEPDPATVLETAMGATVLPEVRDVNPATFLPSSRSVAFRRTAWAAVGGYPAWLDYSEDVIFDLALRAKFGRFVFAPDARVFFRPRGSLRALAKQYYLYARGDGRPTSSPGSTPSGISLI